MNTQLQEIFKNNRQATWREAYNIALISLLDQGYDLATASSLADDRMLEINWILANPPEED